MFEEFVTGYFKQGAVRVRLPNGSEIASSDAKRGLPAVVVGIRNWKTVRTIMANPALALGEAYMDGDLVYEQGGIYDFLDLVGRNFGNRKIPFSGLFGDLRRKLHVRRTQANARDRARRNVEHHYDLSGDLYRRFLDSDLQYSCAYFPFAGASLEEAQAAKKRHIAAKLLLRPGDRVLDIGSGWGGLAMTLAEESGADVTGVTLSQEQLMASSERAQKRGLSEHVRFELADYRDVKGQFDRIVSVGMFEHVGVPNYATFFRTVARLLKEDGVALIHSIGQCHGPGYTSPFIDKYIFPGGYIPALSEVLPAVEAAGLFVTDIEILRLHYAETLREWRKRYEAQRDEIRALYDERFCRMWDYYLAAAEVSFRYGDHMVFQLQISKKLETAPLTRDYITDYDRAAAHRQAKVAAE
jgi:cyclopropane-fatty-acyl-phospholipid synthase